MLIDATAMECHPLIMQGEYVLLVIEACLLN